MTAVTRAHAPPEVLALSGSEMERAVRAGMTSPGRAAAAIFESLGDQEKGRAAYHRIFQLALPSMVDGRSREFYADDENRCQWWHTAFFEALGSYPLRVGESPSAGSFIAHARPILAQATRPCAEIIRFPLIPKSRPPADPDQSRQT